MRWLSIYAKKTNRKTTNGRRGKPAPAMFVLAVYSAKTFLSLANLGRPLTFSSPVSPWISGLA